MRQCRLQRLDTCYGSGTLGLEFVSNVPGFGIEISGCSFGTGGSSAGVSISFLEFDILCPFIFHRLFGANRGRTDVPIGLIAGSFSTQVRKSLASTSVLRPLFTARNSPELIAA
jgi:hypothetical protein